MITACAVITHHPDFGFDQAIYVANRTGAVGIHDGTPTTASYQKYIIPMEAGFVHHYRQSCQHCAIKDADPHVGMHFGNRISQNRFFVAVKEHVEAAMRLPPVTWSTSLTSLPEPASDKDRIIKYGDNIYSIYDQQRHLVRDMSLFYAYSFKDDDIQTVSKEEFEKYSEGLPLLRYRKHDATVILHGDIFAVTSGHRYKVPDFDKFLSDGNIDKYNSLSVNELDAIPIA